MTHPTAVTLVLSALFSAALAACRSSNAGPTPETTARDASLPPDAIVVPDGSSDHFIASDTAGNEASAPDVSATEAASPDAIWVADAAPDTVDAPSSEDTISVTDAAPGPDIATTMSSIQRIADPQVPDADSTTLAADNAAFAFDAYKQLILTNTTNLIFSPASISIALAMTYAGAAGATATEMAQALHFTLPPERLHPAFNDLDQALASRGQGKLGADGGPMRLHLVNALWAEKTYTFKTDFLNILAANYGAGVNLLDFKYAPDPSRVTINDWVAYQTENKIQNVLPPGSIGTLTRLVLTNVVYFNSAWHTSFDPAKTADGSFALLDGSSVTTKFMKATLPSLPMMQGTNFVAASLPYADESLSLVVVVPDTGQFSQVESSLDAPALGTIVAGLRLTSQPVQLALPRFKIETGTSLVRLLTNLGMKSAFDSSGAADFSSMDGTRFLYLSEIIHKAFIDVTEAGTEAAAVTIVVGTGRGGIAMPVNFTANRPYLYFLRDQPTGAILFMGRVLDPSQN